MTNTQQVCYNRFVGNDTDDKILGEIKMKSQEQRVYEYLKEHKVATGLELLKHTGTICYTKAISRLRKELPYKGYTITGKYIEVKTKYNGVSRVMEYSLARLKKKAKKTK